MTQKMNKVRFLSRREICDQIAVKKYIFDTLSIEELIPPVSHYHHREEIVGKFEAMKVLTVNKF